jgi:hypothetical protein
MILVKLFSGRFDFSNAPVCAGNLSASISENQRLENFRRLTRHSRCRCSAFKFVFTRRPSSGLRPPSPAPASEGRRGEGENYFVGRLTQGGARCWRTATTRFALGYYVSGLLPCESVSIGVHLCSSCKNPHN